jgi:hypothetical protein
MESRVSDEVITQRTFSQFLDENQQRAILVQFIRASATMRHIDDLFLWVTQLMVRQLGAQVAQVWAIQANQQGHFYPGLRSFSCRDNSLTQRLATNRDIAAVAARILQAQRSSPLQGVDTTFSPNVSLFLRQHGLNYYVGAFLSESQLLPPASADFFDDWIPTPLAIVSLLFFQQVLHQNVLPDVSSMVQQILQIAKVRGLLLSTPASIDSLPMPPVSPSLQQEEPDLFELIPHRVEDPANNPLAATVFFANEHARRFYAAINGRRNVGELCIMTQLGREEASAVVRMLLTQQRIQLL